MLDFFKFKQWLTFKNPILDSSSMCPAPQTIKKSARFFEKLSAEKRNVILPRLKEMLSKESYPSDGGWFSYYNYLILSDHFGKRYMKESLRDSIEGTEKYPEVTIAGISDPPVVFKLL